MGVLALPFRLPESLNLSSGSITVITTVLTSAMTLPSVTVGAGVGVGVVGVAFAPSVTFDRNADYMVYAETVYALVGKTHRPVSRDRWVKVN